MPYPLGHAATLKLLSIQKPFVYFSKILAIPTILFLYYYYPSILKYNVNSPIKNEMTKILGFAHPWVRSWTRRPSPCRVRPEWRWSWVVACTSSRCRSLSRSPARWRRSRTSLSRSIWSRWTCRRSSDWCWNVKICSFKSSKKSTKVEKFFR